MLKIINLKSNVDTGLVTNIDYSIVVSDKGYTLNTNGSLEISGNPKDPNFIPYKNLDEVTVIGWVNEQLSSEHISSVEEQLKKQIQNLVSPTFQTGLPWSNIVEDLKI